MKVNLVEDLIHSNCIHGRRSYRLLLSDNRTDKPLPLLVLLHGVHGSELDWTDQGHLLYTYQQLLDSHKVGPMAVLTPSDGLTGIGTGYLNWIAGHPHQYEDYLLNEVIPAVEGKWNVGKSRENRAISGLSMGGYAAFRLAFSHPSRFISASSLSGFFHAKELENLIGSQDFELMTGDSSDVISSISPLTMDLPDQLLMPRLLFDCGTSDSYLTDNREMRDRLLLSRIPFSYQEHDGGHTWHYWSEHIREHLLFHWNHLASASA